MRTTNLHSLLPSVSGLREALFKNLLSASPILPDAAAWLFCDMPRRSQNCDQLIMVGVRGKKTKSYSRAVIVYARQLPAAGVLFRSVETS